MSEQSEERLLNVKQVASRLGVSVRTVWRVLASEPIKVVKIRGATRVPETEVSAYIDLMKVTPRKGG